MAESVDALVSNTSGAIRAGSTPAQGTEKRILNARVLFSISGLSEFESAFIQPAERVADAPMYTYVLMLNERAVGYFSDFLLKLFCFLLFCVNFVGEDVFYYKRFLIFFGIDYNFYSSINKLSMRKNALLIPGALALTLGLGVIGMTAGNVLSAPEAVAPQAADVNFFDLLGERYAPASSILSAGSTDNHFIVSGNYASYVVNEFAWELTGDLDLGSGSQPVVVTYVDGTSSVKELFTIPAGDDDTFFVEPPFPAFNLPGALTIDMAESQKAMFDAPGDYIMSFPAGYFVSDGENVGAFTLTITIEGAAPVDYSYTLSPEDNAVVESLSLITVSFDTNSVTYCDGAVATLSNESGYTESAKYPTLDGGSLVFNFAGPEGGWTPGIYTFTVLDKQICVNPDPFFDDSESGAGNVEGFSATYVIEKAVNTIDFDAIASLVTPDALEANRKNTTTQFGVSGMGVVVIGLNQMIHPVNGNEMILYSYKENESAEEEILNVLNPLNEYSGIILGGIAAADEFGGEFGDYRYSMTFLFAQDFDDYGLIIDPSQFPKYRRTGMYTLVIPDGAYALEDGTLVNGFTLTYAYDDSEDVYGLGYEITPEPGKYDTAAELFKYGSEGVKVSFTDAKFIDYQGRPATLTLPNGEMLPCNTPQGSYNNTYLTFTFGNNETDWSQMGEYVFEVKAGCVGLDQGFEDDWEDMGVTPNFPGLKAIYIVGATNVCIVDLESASSYDVYTLDGKTLMLGASSEDLTTLSAGLYVINGNKVRVVK